MTPGSGWAILAQVNRETVAVQGVDMFPKESVIVIEDEPVTRALVVGWLRAAGLEVHGLDRAQGLFRLERLDHVALVVLDIELPDGDGFGVARWVRERSEAGIIFLSRLSEPSDRVRGLDLGGDDFIVKPPDPDELLARVRAVLRRRRLLPASATTEAPAARAAPKRVTFDGWTFDADRFVVTAPVGAATVLTPGETCVLEHLVAAGGRVVSRQVLSAALSGRESNGNARSLDVVVHRLRKKLGEGGNVLPRVLVTVHGIGYRLGVAVAAD